MITGADFIFSANSSSVNRIGPAIISTLPSSTLPSSSVISKSYVVFFDKISGALSHLLEVTKQDKSIIMPKVVLEYNQDFLKKSKVFSVILDKVIVV